MAGESAPDAAVVIDRSVDLFDLIREVRRGLVGYAAIVVAAGLAALALGFVLPKTYRAEVTLRPLDNDAANSGLSSILGQLGPISSAGLALLRPGNGAVTAVATLRSRELTREFVHREDLLPVLFYKKWNADTGQWKADDPGDIPTDWDAYRLFDESIRQVNEDRRTGIVRVSVDWRDPILAAKWANGLVALADGRMRERAIDESGERLRLLRLALQDEPAIEVQRGIYKLVEAEIQRIVMAKSSRDFAFTVIDPAVVPDRDAQVRPKPVLYALLGLIIGAFGASLLVLVRVVGDADTRSER